MDMADAFLMHIAGEWVPSESGATFDAVSPSTGEVIGSVPEGTREDARRAIASAGKAAPAWARLSAFDRAAAMERIASEIDRRRDDLPRPPPPPQGEPPHA